MTYYTNPPGESKLEGDMLRAGGGAKEAREGAEACDFRSLVDSFAYSIARQKMIE